MPTHDQVRQDRIQPPSPPPTAPPSGALLYKYPWNGLGSQPKLQAPSNKHNSEHKQHKHNDSMQGGSQIWV